MSNKKASGVIEVVARNGKAFKLENGEEWYSVFKAGQMSGAEAGAAVSFEYAVVTKGGKDFNNVQGNLSVTEGAPKTVTSAGTSVNTKDVSMTRGGALKVAAPVVMAYYGENPPTELEHLAEDIITFSRLLERYVYEG